MEEITPLEGRILVVDDDGTTRYSLARTLQNMGCEVEMAAGGEEALDLFDSAPHDVVLVDVEMPQMDGLALLAELKARDPDALVILMSDKPQTQNVIVALQLGAVDYWAKPPFGAQMRESVARSLKRARFYRRRREMLLGIRESASNLLNGTFESAPEPPPRSSKKEESAHAPGAPTGVIDLDVMRIYPERYQITIDGRAIDMTPTEFDLLLYLAANREHVVSCADLVREVQGYTLDEEKARQMIRPHISNLRGKLKQAGQPEDIIATVRGAGYRLDLRPLSQKLV